MNCLDDKLQKFRLVFFQAVSCYLIYFFVTATESTKTLVNQEIMIFIYHLFISAWTDYQSQLPYVESIYLIGK